MLGGNAASITVRNKSEKSKTQKKPVEQDHYHLRSYGESQDVLRKLPTENKTALFFRICINTYFYFNQKKKMCKDARNL